MSTREESQITSAEMPGKVNRRYKIACLTTHPIQYQAPLFRVLAKHPALDLTVFFLASLQGGRDPGFGVSVKWDAPLLDGYRYEFLPCIGARTALSFWRPWTHGLSARLRAGQFDALWIHGYAHRALLTAIASCRALSIPVLLRGDSQLGSDPRSPTRLRLKRALIPRLFAMIDGFLAVGSLNREYYLSYGAPAERIFMMPYAVDNAFFRDGAERAHRNRDRFRAELGLEGGRPVILYASKLQSHKSPRDLLEAYAQILSGPQRELRPYLMFVGDGEERGALEARASELGSDSVRFLGFRNQTELPAFYDLADVFILPSEFEPWGLIVNEVMNAARPVIVSDRVGAAPDLVANGVNGFVYPSGDIAALADRIGRVLVNPELGAEMGRASLTRIADFSFEKDADGLVGALDVICSLPSKAGSARLGSH